MDFSGKDILLELQDFFSKIFPIQTNQRLASVLRGIEQLLPVITPEFAKRKRDTWSTVFPRLEEDLKELLFLSDEHPSIDALIDKLGDVVYSRSNVDVPDYYDIDKKYKELHENVVALNNTINKTLRRHLSDDNGRARLEQIAKNIK
jgi:hypothetical protein